MLRFRERKLCGLRTRAGNSSSLGTLRHHCLMYVVSRIVSCAHGANLEEDSYWKNPKWVRLKKCLQGALASQVLQDIFDAVFKCGTVTVHNQKVEYSNAKYPPGIVKSIRELSGRSLFLVWWLVLDCGYTSQLDVDRSDWDRDFNLEVVTFLRSNPSNLSKLSMSYNWILKSDYAKVFQNLPKLKNFTILYDRTGSWQDLLSEIQKHCICLEKLTVSPGPEQQSRLVDFFATSRAVDRLLLLDMGMGAGIDPSVVQSLGRLRALQSLTIAADKADFRLDRLPPLPNLQELNINCDMLPLGPESHEWLTWNPEKYPSLTVLKLYRIVHLDYAWLTSHGSQLSILADVTHVSLRPRVVHDPFPLLRLFQNATSISFKPLVTKRLPRMPKMDVEAKLVFPNLSHLEISAAPCCCSYQTFKSIFLTSNCLKHFSLSVYTLCDFDEEDFVQSLTTRRLKLTHIDLGFQDKQTLITSRTIGALLKHCSRLEELERFMNFVNLSQQDEDNLIAAAKHQGLFELVYAEKIDRNTWRTEDGRDFVDYLNP